MNTLAYIATRMKEASSWGGAALMILGALHVSANPDLVNAALGLIAAVGGLVAVLVPEGNATNLVRSFVLVAALGVAAISLSACQAVQDVRTIGDAQAAVGMTAAAVNTIQDPQASNIAKAQATACAGQAAANALADMFASTGHPTAAARAGTVSAALGEGCTWPLPAR